eukprot:ANDGO_03234.mRNA.1 Protein mesA
MALIHALVFAEFDIDKGAVVRCQVPQPLPIDDHPLAELMLPDGSHLRQEDWTAFVIRPQNPRSPKSTPSKAVAQVLQPSVMRQHHTARVYTFDAVQNDWVRLLGLVSHSENIVLSEESIAFTTDEGSLLMSLPLKTPSSAADDENPGDLSFTVVDKAHPSGGVFGVLSLPKSDPSLPASIGLLFFTEREAEVFGTSITVVQASTVEDVDLVSTGATQSTNFDSSPTSPENHEQSSAVGDAFDKDLVYYCFAFVTTKRDKAMKRGASVRSVAFASTAASCYALRPFLRIMSDEIASSPYPAEEIVRLFYQKINAVKLPANVLVTHSSLLADPLKKARNDVWRRVLPAESSEKKCSVQVRFPGIVSTTSRSRSNSSLAPSDSSASLSSAVSASVLSVPSGSTEVALPFPTILSGVGLDDPRVSTTRLVELLAAHTMPLVAAVLAEKRIMFLARQKPAADVVFLVLAVPFLFSDDVVDSPYEMLKRRLFPYVSLTHLTDLMSVKGFIAGTTHPIFEERCEWWDMLVDCDEQKVILAPSFYTVNVPASFAGSPPGASPGSDSTSSSASNWTSTSNASNGSGSPTALAVMFEPTDTESQSFKQLLIRLAALRLRQVPARSIEDFCRWYMSHLSRNMALCSLSPAVQDVHRNMLITVPYAGGPGIFLPEYFKIIRGSDLWNRLFRRVASKMSPREGLFRSVQRRAFRLQAACGVGLDHQANNVVSSIPPLPDDDISEYLHRFLLFLSPVVRSSFLKRASESKVDQMGSSSDVAGIPVSAHANSGVESEKQSTAENVVSENEALALHVCNVLSLFPACASGLMPLAACLFHSKPLIRLGMVALLRRLEQVPEGRDCVSGLGTYYLLAYDRISRTFVESQIQEVMNIGILKPQQTGAGASAALV